MIREAERGRTRVLEELKRGALLDGVRRVSSRGREMAVPGPSGVSIVSTAHCRSTRGAGFDDPGIRLSSKKVLSLDLDLPGEKGPSAPIFTFTGAYPSGRGVTWVTNHTQAPPGFASTSFTAEISTQYEAPTRP